MNLPSIRRARAAGVALALAAGGLLAAPAPAQAVVFDGEVQAGVDFEYDTTLCTLTGSTAPPAPTPLLPNGAPVQQTATNSATVTRNSDPTDVTNLSGTSTIRAVATEANGALRTVDITTSFSAALSASKGIGQTCDAAVDDSGTGTQFVFDLPAPKLVTIDIESRGAAGIIAVGQLGSMSFPEHGAQAFYMGSHTTQTVRTYLPAGAGNIGVNFAQTQLDAPDALGEPTSRSASATIHIELDDPGTATTAAKGGGKKYVDLANGRTCATGTLTGTWKKRAGKGDRRTVKKAKFFVNDVKVKTVKRPKKKQTTTLTGLDPDKPAVVEVRLKLARRGAGSVTVERSYLNCT